MQIDQPRKEANCSPFLFQPNIRDARLNVSISDNVQPDKATPFPHLLNLTLSFHSDAYKSALQTVSTELPGPRSRHVWYRSAYVEHEEEQTPWGRAVFRPCPKGRSSCGRRATREPRGRQRRAGSVGGGSRRHVNCVFR